MHLMNSTKCYTGARLIFTKENGLLINIIDYDCSPVAAFIGLLSSVRVCKGHVSVRVMLQFGFFLHDFLCNFDDGLCYVVLLLSANFEPFDMIFFEEGDIFLWNLGEVSFVAFVDEAVDPIFRRVLFGLLYPVPQHVLEGLGVRDIVDQDDCICALVVRLSDASEALLAGSVPDLQFHKVVLDVHRPCWGKWYLKRKSMPMVEM